MTNSNEFQYTNIAGAATTQVFTGKGLLHAIVINTTAAGTINIVDATSGTTPSAGIIVASAGVGTYLYDIALSAGCRIITGAASNITVVWAQA